MKKARPNLTRRRLAGSKPRRVRLSVCLPACAWQRSRREVNLRRGCPIARSPQHLTSPGRGEGSVLRDTLLFCPCKYSGNAGQTGGRSALSCVCAANIFIKVLFPNSFSEAFVPLISVRRVLIASVPLDTIILP